GPGRSHQAGGHDRVPGPRRDRDALDDPRPSIADPVSPRAQDGPRERAQLAAVELDQQGGLGPAPVAELDFALADPDTQQDRLGLAAVDAEGAADPGGPARGGGPEAEEVRPDRAPLGNPGDVAGVVPAVRDAVLVGVGLQIVE